MFNPQRRSKVNDIFMEERNFQLHLDKVRNIRQSYSLTARRNKEQQDQQTYLQRLERRRKEVRNKLKGDIHRENRRLLDKLNAADNRPQENPEQKLPEKHLHSYYNNKKMQNRIRSDNMSLLNRMVHQSSMVPTLQQMKKDFKQNKRYGNMVRKLPSILKHELDFKRQLSSRRLSDSKMSLRSGKSSRSIQRTIGERSATEQIRSMEKTLLDKQKSD